jgi:hypothetical protein
MVNFYSMRVFACTLLLITIGFLAQAQTGLRGKSVPFDFYPEQYKSITADNWSEAKQVLDSTLTFKDETTLRYSRVGIQAWYILARLADIDGSNSQKKEVSNYLKEYSQNILSGNSFIKDFQKLPFPNKVFLQFDPVFLPHKAIWVMFNLDEQVACTTVEYALNNIKKYPEDQYYSSLHLAVLWSMEKRFKSDLVFNCLQTVQKAVPTTTDADKESIIDNFLLKRELFKLNNEAKAWNYLWENFQNKNQTGVLTPAVQGIWRKNILLMQEIYPNLDISVLLNMADKEKETAKKYILLYGATFLINDKTSLAPQEVDLKEKEHLKKLIGEFYKNENLNKSQLSGSTSDYDFLKTASELVK